MKQHITQEQWNELTSEQNERLVDWLGSRIEFNCNQIEETLIRNCTIGKMIEAIADKTGYVPEYTYEYGRFIVKYMTDYDEPIIKTNLYEELCDTLWEAVKSVL